MIITVTMNPAMDKTVEVESLHIGGLNRVKRTYYDAGGKGINVSKTIGTLSGKSLALGFLSGNTGRKIEEELDARGIRHDFVWTEGETRTNTKLVDEKGCVTELNEQGANVSKEKLEELKEKIASYANQDALFLLSGSVPPGAGTQIYAELLELIHEKGGRAVLDAEGELLHYGLAGRPDFIKPNQYELFGLLQEEVKEGCDVLLQVKAATRKIKEMGIRNCIVSMGEAGAYFSFEGYEQYLPALPVRVRSSVGAGDAMVAALAIALERGLTEEKTAKLCMAASAGAVMMEGSAPPDKETVCRLLEGNLW